MIRSERLATSVPTHPRRAKSRACTLPDPKRDRRAFRSAQISVKNSAADVGLAKAATEEVGVATAVFLVGTAVELEEVTLEATAVEIELGVAVVVRPTLVTVAVMLSVGVAECAVEEAEAV
ncbi:hypothetical protein BDV24DRAFT_170631 [Aspergillus arachidicola]|uniref:Uncharacterized protein n=1 Tax=Aspergillus arachidicola TaxID=656916 RepID=A0A5N6XNY9_9EURO|nr:hypothetical protein BDV24DRAFT_170631 [Aspergillus arachidicola]